MWESLEMSLPYKLQSVFQHNSSDAQLVIKRIHFSSQHLVKETGSEILRNLKGMHRSSPKGSVTFQREHGRTNTSSLKPNVSPHWCKKPHECLNDTPQRLSLLRWITAPLWLILCLPEDYSFHSLECKDDGFIFLHYFNCRKNKKQTWDQFAE